MIYEIIIKGYLTERMADSFVPLEFEYLDGGLTRLTGFMTDQAALYGLLSKIRDFNIELVELKKMNEI